jgi:hypothetical protein
MLHLLRCGCVCTFWSRGYKYLSSVFKYFFPRCYTKSKLADLQRKKYCTILTLCSTYQVGQILGKFWKDTDMAHWPGWLEQIESQILVGRNEREEPVMALTLLVRFSTWKIGTLSVIPPPADAISPLICLLGCVHESSSRRRMQRRSARGCGTLTVQTTETTTSFWHYAFAWTIWFC